jgi:hypothetical protein
MAVAMFVRRCVVLGGALLYGGCGVPSFDVPVDQNRQPTAKTIVQRLECEVRDLVRDDHLDDPDTINGPWLLNGDFDVQIALSLEVNDSGGLAPSVSFLGNVNGFMHPSTYTLGTTGALSEGRDHTFNENIQLSVRQIYMDWKSGAKLHDCPSPDTNLSGTLGIKHFVELAASTPDLVDPLPSSPSTTSASVFGGSVQFVVTKNITSAGPTFALVHFKSISVLGSLSEINTDKVTLAFAHGPNIGKKMPPITPLTLARVKANGYPANGFNSAAYEFLQQQITSSITWQLIILQKSLTP